VKGGVCLLIITSSLMLHSLPAAAFQQRPQRAPRKLPDLNLRVDVYDAAAVCDGTTVLTDNCSVNGPRVIEVDMKGEIVWQYVLPEGLKRYTNPGFDVEPLPNGDFLLALPRKGVFEINREGDIVWSYMDGKVSHDVDRLPNGNTLIVWGGSDETGDAQAKEIDPEGKVVWAWYAKDYFYHPPYKDIYEDGWTHANAVSRLANGNTLISLRNFHFVVEVDAKGAVVRTIGDGLLKHQHDPEPLPNGNVLIANHGRPQAAVEIDPDSGEVVWEFKMPDRATWPVRDANRLPNGNTLITGTTEIVEVTRDGQVVWDLVIEGAEFRGREAASLGFYKAHRIPASGL